MAFRSRKLAKTLALVASCSSFVCQSRVSCVKKWALGDTERSDDKESLCMYPIRRFKTEGIYGFFDVETKFLCIDGVGEIDKFILADISDVVPIKDVQSVSIGKDITLTCMCLEDFVSLESVTVESSRLRTKLTKKKEGERASIEYFEKFGNEDEREFAKYLRENKGDIRFNRYLRQMVDDLIPTSQLIIDDNVFAECSTVKSIRILKNVTAIGKSAFMGCISLQEVKLPDSLREISNYAFAECSALKSIRIPKDVTAIGEYAFYNCNSLTDVELPDSLLKIDNSAFYYCSALKSIKIPQYVTEIGNSVFYQCKSLEKVQLPDSLRKIGKYAFFDCKALTSIEIPKNVTEIGNDAFYGCDSLVEARVPRNAKIGQDAFPDTTHVTLY